MSRSKPVVALRRPPASVDAFVVGSDVQTSGSPDVQTPKHPDVQASERSVVVRKDGRRRRRTTIYFEPELARELKVFCASTGRELSSVVSEAVAAYIRR